MNEEIKNEKDELNDLKSLWKSQADEKSYDSTEIFKMIHRKSLNSVQWLFIISVVEMALGVLITLWSVFSGKHLYAQNSVEIMGEENIRKLEIVSNFGFVLSLILAVIIYYYYKKISSNSSVNELIGNIVKFRKNVIICLIVIAVVLLSFMLPIYFDIGKNIASQNLDLKQSEHLESAGNFTGWFIAIISTFSFALIFFVYYFVIYGFFLRRLKKNQKELNQINK